MKTFRLTATATEIWEYVFYINAETKEEAIRRIKEGDFSHSDQDCTETEDWFWNEESVEEIENENKSRFRI